MWAVGAVNPSPLPTPVGTCTGCAWSTTGRPATSRPTNTSRWGRSWARVSPPRCRRGWSASRRSRPIASSRRPRTRRPPPTCAPESPGGSTSISRCSSTSAAMREHDIPPLTVSTTSFADMYWTPAQQLAHMTANGASVRPGDLFASGTVSGPTSGSEGSLIELTWRGERPIELPDGSRRTFLADGDRVTLRGWAGGAAAPASGSARVSGTITITASTTGRSRAALPPGRRRSAQAPHRVTAIPHGTAMHEELMGQEGFSSRSALLYHRNSPSAITAIEPIDPHGLADLDPDQPADATPHPHRRSSRPCVRSGPGPHRPARQLGRYTSRAPARPTPARSTATRSETNSSTSSRRGAARIGLRRARRSGPGDYVVIPASTTHRWVVDDGPVDTLVHRRDRGTWRRRGSTSRRPGSSSNTPRTASATSRAPRQLLDCRRARTFHVAGRARPRPGSPAHPSPPSRSTSSDGTATSTRGRSTSPTSSRSSAASTSRRRCTRPSRGPGSSSAPSCRGPFDFHPDAVKVPYHHANTDCDEVLFYSDGDFMSRAGSGIGVGSISFHPAGFVHGPQPGQRTKPASTRTAPRRSP